MSICSIMGGENIDETLFSAIFALYFAANIASARSFQAFDTAAIAACDWYAGARLIVGIALLNVVPFVYYLLVMEGIPCIPQLHRPFFTAAQIMTQLLILMLGTVGAGFYRLFAGIMMIRRNDHLCFYAPRDVGSCPTRSGVGLNYNSQGYCTGPDDSVRRHNINALHHLSGSLFYFVPPLILWWILAK